MTLLSKASDKIWRFLIAGRPGQDRVQRAIKINLGVLCLSAAAIHWTTRYLPLIYLSALALLAVQRTWAYVSTWTFRRHVLAPTVSVLDPVIRKHSPSGQGLIALDIPRDIRDNEDAMIVVHLPMDWTPEKADMARVSTLLCQRLSMDTLNAAWTLSGRKPHVTFGQPPKPPERVTFDEMVMAADMCADTCVVMGQGTRGQTVLFDLAIESPHALLAAGSGAGKSELLAWLAGQFMRRGYGIVVLDAKFTSHMWLRRVPGILYAAESEELHDTLLWLDEELLRRARFISAGGDPAALEPLVVIAEEMNGATNRLRSYWRGEGGKGMSPALTALANLSAMGRELRIHILMAGQSMTANATGGAASRESFGARALARATSNQWKMLAPQIKPAPVKKTAPGRWHLVVGDSLKEFQAPFVDIKGQMPRLIEWATGAAQVLDVPALMTAAATTADARMPTSEVVAAEGVSLRLFANEHGVSYQSLIDWRNRRTDFPIEVGQGANRTKLYDQDHLKAFVTARLREPVGEVR